MGYGKISLQVSNLPEEVMLACLKPYEIFMEWSLGGTNNSWIKSSQLSELFSMAKPGTNDESLKYMALTDFVNAKGRRRTDPKFTLQRYSEILNNRVQINGLSSESDIKEATIAYLKEQQLFEKQQDIKTLKASILAEQEKDFTLAFNLKKQQLLEQLAAKREGLAFKEKADKEALEQHEKQNRKKADQERAMLRGFDPGKIDPLNRSAFDDLGKEILRFSKIIYNVNDNQLKEKFPEGGYLPEQEQEKVTVLLQGIFANIRAKKDKDKWLQKPMDKNHIYLKIRLWLGDAAATSLMEKLENV